MAHLHSEDRITQWVRKQLNSLKVKLYNSFNKYQELAEENVASRIHFEQSLGWVQQSNKFWLLQFTSLAIVDYY